MTKRMEQTQNAKMVQLALFREYGFQPCLKDIKILNTRDFDEFPGHVKAISITSFSMLPVKQPFTNTKADGGPVGGRKAARQKVRSPSQQPKGENKQ